MPPITSRPPKSMTAPIESVGRKSRPGRYAPRPAPDAARRRARLRLAGEARLHVVLAPECLHHLDPDDGLVRRLGDVGLQLLHLARDRHHLAREREREQEHSRHRDQRDRGELDVDEEQDDRDPEDHHQRLDPLGHAPADEVADGVEVVGRARDDLTGGVPVVERARIAQVCLVEQLAHPCLHADAGARRRVAAREVDREPDRREHDDDDEVRPQRLAVAVRRRDRVVDRVPDDERDREREPGVDEGARQADEDEPFLLAPQPGEPLRRRPEAEIRRIDRERAPAHPGKLPEIVNQANYRRAVCGTYSRSERGSRVPVSARDSREGAVTVAGMNVIPIPGLEHLPFAEVWFHELDDARLRKASARARVLGKTGLEVWTTTQTPAVASADDGVDATLAPARSDGRPDAIGFARCRSRSGTSRRISRTSALGSTARRVWSSALRPRRSSSSNPPLAISASRPAIAFRTATRTRRKRRCTWSCVAAGG